MNYSENDNIYEFNARNVLTKYAGFVEGSPECMVVACASGALSAQARDAISASCDKLGIGECAWVDAHGAAALASAAAGAEDEASARGSEADARNVADARGVASENLFELVEGLDPVVIIASDGAAAEALGAAYGCDIPQDAASRVFGRTCVAFRNFEAMLGSSDSKQRAWALLKQLIR